MSYHESEVSPASPAVEPGMPGFSSTNGNDPGAMAAAAGNAAGLWADDSATFLSELARAMQAAAAAEQARDAETTTLRRQAHIDAIRAREAVEAEEFREFAKEDVKGIDAWSDGEIKRVKLERERRIASRRDQLQTRLEEHRAVVTREVEAVESAITAYRTEIEQFFTHLEFEIDPVEIARQAGLRPPFPALELIGPYDAPPAYAASTTPLAPEFIAPSPTLATFAAPVMPVMPVVPVAYEHESAPESAPAEEEAPSVTVAPEAEDHHRDDDGPAAASPMVGVMDLEASSPPIETGWDSGVDVIEEPVADEPQVSEGSSEPHASEEPVAVAAEAMVVMPRSTGAGSWLRWPNASADRSDPSH